MKRFGMIAALIAGIAMVLSIVGCATTQPAEQETKTAQRKQKTVEYEIIDWDGAIGGKDMAEWPFYLQDDGLKALDDYPGIKEKVEGKKYFLTTASNEKKNLAREESRNALSFQLASQFSQRALGTFAQVIDNNEESQETINSAAQKAQFTGFERVAESWVFRLKIDHSKKDKTTEEYTYYDLFACEEDIFKAQVEKYLNDIIGNVVIKSENMKRAEELRDGLIDEFMNDDKAFLQEIEQ